MRWKVENYLWAPWCELPRRKRMRWVPPCLKTIFQSFHIFNIDNPQCWKVRNNPFLPWHLKSWFTFCRFGTVDFCTYQSSKVQNPILSQKSALVVAKEKLFWRKRPKCCHGLLLGGGSASKSWSEKLCWWTLICNIF